MGETKPTVAGVVGSLTPSGLKRIFNSSKTWLVVLATVAVYWFCGGFSGDADAKVLAVTKVVEFLKYAIPVVIAATGIEDCGGKIFGKVGELTTKPDADSN